MTDVPPLCRYCWKLTAPEEWAIDDKVRGIRYRYFLCQNCARVTCVEAKIVQG